MTRKELIKNIAIKGKTKITEATAFYEIWEQVIWEAITNDAEVVLAPSLGKFVLSTLAARQGPEMAFKTNPKTGKKTIVKTGRIAKYPASTVVRFKPSQALKKAVKSLQLK